MRFFNILRVSARALTRNIGRTILTALGVVIGVGSVVAMVGIGNGARTQIADRIAQLGQNIVLVFPGSFNSAGVRTGWGGRQSLVPADAMAIQREIPEIAGVSPEVRSRAQVLANGLNWNTQILGESSDYSFIRNWPLAAGAMFSPEDVTRKAKVAVVGSTVLKELNFGDQPLGQTIRIGNVPFRIVGVFATRGFDVRGSDQDDLIVVPYTSHMSRLQRRTFLSNILVAADGEEDFDAVQQGITDLLRERHEITANEPPDFLVRTQAEITEAATATASTMTLLLGAIAGVSLIVGGIGIMNILLVSVTERTREIGLRLAIGAHQRDVLLQFLTEAVILSVAGGVLGLALGVGASEVMSRVYGWPVSVPPWAMFGAVAFSAAVGIFFGLYPAQRASRLDPIDALRFE
jgi:putative ABC transport system permease protein